MVGNPSLTENQPQISQISQRNENPKNICGKLSHLWMTARSLLSEGKGTHLKQRETLNLWAQISFAELGENHPQISQISQRSKNPKNICGNLSHLWMTALKTRAFPRRYASPSSGPVAVLKRSIETPPFCSMEV